jgi:hypothetical protein
MTNLDVSLLDTVRAALDIDDTEESWQAEGVPTEFRRYVDRAAQSLLTEPGPEPRAAVVTPRRVCERAIGLIDRDMVGQHGWRAHVLTQTRRLFARVG